MKNALIIDDDKNINNILGKYFIKEGFNVYSVLSAEEGMEILKNNEIDIIILDYMLPGIDGLEFCKVIRPKYSVPIIMLTAKNQIEDKIDVLSNGADDYVVKPFDPNEIIARTKAVLRRYENTFNSLKDESGERVLKCDSLEINLDRFEVKVDGKVVDLYRREFQLLEFFVSNPNKVFDRNKIIESIWGWDFEGEDRVIDLYVERLRKKLNVKKKNFKWNIKTIWGIGYKFEVSDV